jgi:hypothetical protein
MINQLENLLRRYRIELSVFSFTHHSYGREHERPSEEDFDYGRVQPHVSIMIS